MGAELVEAQLVPLRRAQGTASAGSFRVLYCETHPPASTRNESRPPYDPETFVQVFTKTLEWRCLDQIRAPIQESRVPDVPDRAFAAGGG
jgi:hypothetical protein